MALTDRLSAPDRHPYLSGEITYLTGKILHFSGDQALSFSLSEGSSNGNLLGGAFSAACTLTLNNADAAFTNANTPYGAQVKVRLCEGEDSAEMITFTVTKVVKRENDPRLTLSGCDAIGTAFDGAWADSLAYPCSLLDIAQAIAAQAGFSISHDDFPNAGFCIPAMPDWGDISLRQALSYVACACGCFARINRQGRLRLEPLTRAMDPFPINAQNTLAREWGEMAFGPLRALTFSLKGAKRGEAPLIVAEEGAVPAAHNSFTISGNPLFSATGTHTAALAQALLNALSGYTLTKARVTWRGNPNLELGCKVRIIDSQGQSTDTVITSQVLTFSQGFSMQSDCSAPNVSASVGKIFTSSGALNAALLEGSVSGAIIRDGTLAASSLIAASITAQQLAAGAVSTEALSAGAVTAEKIAAGAVTADALSAEAVDAKHLSAAAIDAVYSRFAQADIDWANIGSLQAAVAELAAAQIASADIDWARIKDIVANRAIITQGEAGELYIARLAVTEANLVSLTVGELMVKGSDGGFYAVRVDEAGQVVTERKQIDNADVQDASIHAGKKLMEGSVTAHTLNAQDIFGDSAIIRQLIAQNLDVDTFFARDATISKLNALDITGNESIRLYVKSQEKMNAYLRVTENGLEIGREGDSARFRADNRTMEVTNVKTERLGISQAMGLPEEWAFVATKTGLGLKYIGA
ncbi:MAG: hypothetical protein IJ189_05975 [Clostridia bacterium]|nr:hypothetical protein [Clostridia bacterium]